MGGASEPAALRAARSMMVSVCRNTEENLYLVGSVFIPENGAFARLLSSRRDGQIWKTKVWHIKEPLCDCSVVWFCLPRGYFRSTSMPRFLVEHADMSLYRATRKCILATFVSKQLTWPHGCPTWQTLQVGFDERGTRQIPGCSHWPTTCYP